MASPLKVKLELRAITNSHLNRESAVMITSTIPSAKYSCSGSPLMFSNGSTAIAGFVGWVQRAARFGVCWMPCADLSFRRPHGVDADCSANILQRSLAHIFEGKRHLPPNVPERIIGEINPA